MNNKGTDQTARMRRLICALVVPKPQIQGFSQRGGAQWLSGRVLDSRPKGRGFEPHRRHCILSLNNNINLSFVLVQPRKTRPFITERLLMGRKESNQTNKQTKVTKRPICKSGRRSNILSIFLFLFSNKMFGIRTGFHKLLVQIANSEDPY